MPLDELEDIEWVKSHMWQVLKAYQIIDKQLAAIKEEVKLTQTDTQYWDVTAKYTSYIKLKPRNIQDIMSRYPIEEYPQLYNVTLSKEAQHIITDEWLFETVNVEAVRMELPQ